MTALVGKVVEKRGKALGIEVEEEQGKPEKHLFGRGAIKGDAESGYFIPSGFTKEKLTTETKIILPEFDAELEAAPVVEPKGNGEHEHEHKEEEGGEKAQGQGQPREEIIAGKMRTYLQKGREMVEQIFPELGQPQLSELSQDIATSMFIEDRKETRKERY